MRNKWALADAEELLLPIILHLEKRTDDLTSVSNRIITQAATFIYCKVLYVACGNKQDRHRRNIGFSELHYMFVKVTYRDYPEAYQDITQDALEQVFANFDNCRNPETFLAFAFWKLRGVTSRYRGQRDKGILELPSDYWEWPDKALPPEMATVKRDLMIRIHHAFHKVWDDYSDLRERIKIYVVYRFYLSQWSLVEIREALRESLNRIYTLNNIEQLKHRGRNLLRNHPAFRDLWTDFDQLN